MTFCVVLQADKDFVWSLWKRLQVANPDVTQAVAIITQRQLELNYQHISFALLHLFDIREREKAEIKDKKVLDILNAKDEKIEELQKLVANQSKELSETLIA